MELSLFDPFYSGVWPSVSRSLTSMFPESGFNRFTVDVSETPESYVVNVDTPGFAKKDVQVSIDEENRALVMRGEKHYQREHQDEMRRVQERSFGTFYRSLPLPQNVDIKKDIEAKMDNGILRVSLPKSKEQASVTATRGRAIDIK